MIRAEERTDFFERYPTGVARIEDWSLKAWWSIAQQRWLVQVEHRVPERGGWIRGWLVDAFGHLTSLGTLDAAAEAMDTFLDQPDWARCREFPGGVA